MGEDTSRWFLIAHARHGDAVIRVRRGMPLGETATGELSFQTSCAQLELDIADDGALVLSALDDHELQSEQGTRRQRERLVLDRPAEIRLPHNVLQLVTDFLYPERAEETVEVRAAQPMQDILEHAEEPVATRAVEPIQHLVEPRAGHVPGTFDGELADTSPTAAPAVAARPQPLVPSRDERSAEPLHERSGVRRQRIFGLPPLPIPRYVLITAASVGFLVLYSTMRESSVPQPSAVVSSDPTPQHVPAHVRTNDVEGTTTVAEALPPSAPEPLLPSPLQTPRVSADGQPTQTGGADTRSSDDALPAVPASEPRAREVSPSSRLVTQTSGDTEQVARPKTNDDSPNTPVATKPDGNIAGLPPIEPVVRPPVERRSTPPRVDRQSASAIAAQQRRNTETIRARNAELALNALSSADLALAQGRLTTPPEANAYTLYHRVLALDPGSQEARRGLQSVRQGLINRALAQLAGGALDDARRSLQSAADAGADPMLVANLRSEVDYRQRMVNSRGTRNE